VGQSHLNLAIDSPWRDRFVKILLDQELIFTSGREAIVQHRLAGEEACCLNLLFPYMQELHVEEVEDRADAVLITARSRTAEPACHRCGCRLRGSTADTGGGRMIWPRAAGPW
jgi:hypothetical protein